MRNHMKNKSTKMLNNSTSMWYNVFAKEEEMKGLTTYGKYLRKLRVDNNETLKDMAINLGISVAYLSAVELGKREVPSHWNSIIKELYKLDDSKFSELLVEYSNSISDIKFNIKNYGEQERRVITTFARKFSDLTAEQLKEIETIIDEK